MKTVLSLLVVLAAAAVGRADDPRVKWQAPKSKARTQYVYAGTFNKLGVWVATDDAKGGYDVMHEMDRTGEYIVLKSTKYDGLTITLSAQRAVVRQPAQQDYEIPGGWKE